MDRSGVDVGVADGVATVTLCGAKSVNLMGRTLIDALVRTLDMFRRDAALRLVILTGPPGASFQGGVDIGEMAMFDSAAAREFITLLHQACHGLRTLPVPSIARIEGFCLGGGMEIAASCDLRIGTESSRYGMPEVQVGLPSVIEARLLPNLIGWGNTRELLYRGHIIDAPEAHRIGFLQAIAPDVELDVGLRAWCDDILRADAAAIRTQKRLLEDWMETAPAVGIQASIDAFAASFDTDAANRRLRAFLERPRNKR